MSLRDPIQERPDIRIKIKRPSASANTSNTPGISDDAFTKSLSRYMPQPGQIEQDLRL